VAQTAKSSFLHLLEQTVSKLLEILMNVFERVAIATARYQFYLRSTASSAIVVVAMLATGHAIAQTTPEAQPTPPLSQSERQELDRLREEQQRQEAIEEAVGESAVIRDRINAEVERAFRYREPLMLGLLVLLLLLPLFAALCYWILLDRLEERADLQLAEIESRKADAIAELQRWMANVESAIDRLSVTNGSIPPESPRQRPYNPLLLGSSDNARTSEPQDENGESAVTETRVNAEVVEVGSSQPSHPNQHEPVAETEVAAPVSPDREAFEQGNTRFGEGRYEEAIAAYDRALDLQPDNATVWHNRGSALFQLQRYQETVESCDRAVQLRPDYARAWTHRGLALMQLQQFETALESLDRAVDAQPHHADIWNYRAQALIVLQRYQEAIAAYDRATQTKPDYGAAWNNMGFALACLERYEEAIAAYDAAIKIDPNYAKAWMNRGLALVKLERYSEAIEAYDRAVQIEPDNADSWYNRACCHASQGQVDRAIESLQRAIALNSSDYQQLAKTEADFAPLREDERFKQLTNG
jgi:tetratricopeptide (TPR) repeat protein